MFLSKVGNWYIFRPLIMFSFRLLTANTWIIRYFTAKSQLTSVKWMLNNCFYTRNNGTAKKAPSQTDRKFQLIKSLEPDEIEICFFFHVLCAGIEWWRKLLTQFSPVFRVRGNSFLWNRINKTQKRPKNDLSSRRGAFYKEKLLWFQRYV